MMNPNTNITQGLHQIGQGVQQLLKGLAVWTLVAASAIIALAVIF